MFTLRHELETFFVIIAVAFASFFLFRQYNNKNVYHIISPVLSAPVYNQPTPTPTTQTQSVITPDGLKTLVMVNKQADYSFYIENGGDSSTQKQIFSKTVDSTEKFSLPFDGWSPDDSQFFIKNNTGDQANYYVFNANGNPFGDSQYLNITDLFKEKEPNYKLTDVTGWAAPDLVIVNSNTTDGKIGPSFWFVVSSRSFMILSTRFN